MGDIRTRFSIEGEQQFKSAMTNAANATKVLNAEQRLAKATFEQTGNAEKYAATQADILRQKIQAQKGAVAAAEQAIKQLTDNGVNPASRQFQQWQTKLLNAQTALTNTETELQNLNGTMKETSSQAEGTGDAIESIGKKVSLDAVISGIGKITDKMEAAAAKAKELATGLINFMRESASWADDLSTTATVYGFSVEDVQRIQNTARILDTSFETIVKSRQKLVNAMYDGNDAFAELGVQIREWKDLGGSGPELAMRDWEDVFWDLGAALMNLENTKGFEYVNKMASQLLGKGWEQLKPIFNSDWASEDNYLGKAFNSAREYYDAVMESWGTVSDKNVKNLAQLDDAFQNLEINFNTLKETVAGELAPGFTDLTNIVSGLLAEFNEYLASEEGKEKLGELSEAVTDLFSGLKDVDFGAALEIAKGAIDSLTSGLEWIKNNGNSVGGIIRDLAIAFAGLKVAESVLTFKQLLASGKYLFSNGKITGYNGGNTGGDQSGTNTAGNGKTVGDVGSPTSKGKSWLPDVAAVLDEAWKFINAGNILSDGTLSRVERMTQWVDNMVSAGVIKPEDRDDVLRRNMEIEAALGDEEFQIALGIKDPTEEIKEVKEKVGVITFPAQILIEGIAGLGGNAGGGLAGGGKPSFERGLGLDLLHHQANGLPEVPFDGYMAVLHKGEQVMPAREVNNSRNFSSNLYVESMYMNNGMDAQGLASAIAAANRRTMRGYGS